MAINIEKLQKKRRRDIGSSGENNIATAMKSKSLKISAKTLA